MKFIAHIGPDGKLTTFRHDDPGPVPPIVDPPEPEEPKDTAPPEPEKKPRPS